MEKKYRFMVILVVCAIVFPTGLRESSAAESTRPAADGRKDPISYCELLHVQQEPSLPFSPKSYLGIYSGSQKVQKKPWREAQYVTVAGVLRGSPADRIGLRKDDVILSMDGRPTWTDAGKAEEHFRKTIEGMPVGTTIRLEVLRGEEILSLMAQTGERPHHDQPEADHREARSCTGSPSLLASALAADGAMPLFRNVVDGLYRRSNEFHNIDSPWETPFHPLQLKEATYLLRHPLAAGAVAEGISHRLTEPIEEGNGRLDELIRRAVALTDREIPACARPKETTLPALIAMIEETAGRVRQAMHGITSGEQSLLREKALDPWDDPQWNRILEISLKVDRRAMFGALSCLLSFLDRDHLDLLKEDLLKRFPNPDGEILFQAETSAGPVIVGGLRPKVHDRDAALILDLGGHNLYLNNAGGTRPEIPVALVVDWGGHNRYIARDNFSQGAALFGGGFLIDLGGQSTFVALDGSQGAGFWGVGMLYQGAGGSILQARSVSQGAGQMGVGLLVGQGGHNSYSCLHEGQALGLFGGAGVLITGGGENLYRLGGLEPDFRDPKRSTVSMGQGFGYGLRTEGDKAGAPGGIGILIDTKGGNTYLGDYFAQGSSYYYGVGILDNRGGNNRYIAGRYAQGAGIHTAVGVLINRGGQSTYFAAQGVSQGMGHDYGVGFLEDRTGGSDYRGSGLVQGAATRGGLGILVDPGEKSRFADGGGIAKDEECLGILVRHGIPADKAAPSPGGTTVRIGRKPD